MLALPGLNGADRAESERYVKALISAASNRSPRSYAAAFYRLLMSVGSASVKKAASAALRETTSLGAYPPGWVTEIGKPTPDKAWRRHDAFGDEEVIVVTFSYGDKQHGVLADRQHRDASRGGGGHQPGTGPSDCGRRQRQRQSRRPVRGDLAGTGARPGRGAADPRRAVWSRDDRSLGDVPAGGPGAHTTAARRGRGPGGYVHRCRPCKPPWTSSSPARTRRRQATPRSPGSGRRRSPATAVAPTARRPRRRARVRSRQMLGMSQARSS